VLVQIKNSELETLPEDLKRFYFKVYLQRNYGIQLILFGEFIQMKNKYPKYFTNERTTSFFS
jgi:hypothetical protein